MLNLDKYLKTKRQESQQKREKAFQKYQSYVSIKIFLIYYI
jgi:hypothetical protein